MTAYRGHTRHIPSTWVYYAPMASSVLVATVVDADDVPIAAVVVGGGGGGGGGGKAHHSRSFCTQCGFKLEGLERFCGDCGTKIA